MTSPTDPHSTSTEPAAHGAGGWVFGLDRRGRAMLAEMGLSLGWLPNPEAPTQGAATGLGQTEVAAGGPEGPVALGKPPGHGAAPAAPAAAVFARRAPDAAERSPSGPAEGSATGPASRAPQARPAAGATGRPQAASVVRVPAAPAATAAELAALANMDARQLLDAAAVCSACALCQGRHKVVLTEPVGADWLLVGGPPEVAEDAAGQPFVGPAGELLDAFLRASGRRRTGPEGEAVAADAARAQRAHLTHITLCRPASGRVPRPDELAICRHYLARQVALVQPRVILALGQPAAQSLLDSPLPLGRLRGEVHRFLGVPVVVSYAPQFLLRNPIEKARAWADFCLAQSL